DNGAVGVGGDGAVDSAVHCAVDSADGGIIAAAVGSGIDDRVDIGRAGSGNGVAEVVLTRGGGGTIPAAAGENHADGGGAGSGPDAEGARKEIHGGKVNTAIAAEGYRHLEMAGTGIGGKERVNHTSEGSGDGPDAEGARKEIHGTKVNTARAAGGGRDSGMAGTGIGGKERVNHISEGSGDGPDAERKIAGIRIGKLAKILTGSFVVIMAIHLAAFTAIGLFTDAGWRLLWIFLGGLAIMLFVVTPLKYVHKKRRAAQRRPD
ncbi:MAG: hypothetical protein LUD76_03795, partial [Alistipes sp.]|nr:hypothetical protein [Alistipes sp.]